MSKTIKITGTVDIECAGWEKFIVGAVYQPKGGYRTFWHLDDLVTYLATEGGTWWTWGGGRYDSLAIADRLLARDRKATCFLSGSSISRMVSGSLTVRDATALIPMSLEDAAGLAGLRAPRDLGWKCVCGEASVLRPKGCGGYCRISRRMKQARRDELADYCRWDATVAYHAIAAVLTRWTAEGFEIRGTLGGTAWATAAAWAGLPKAAMRSEHWRTARAAYYGGRVIVAQPKSPAGVHLDMVQAYPAALASTAVPVGEPEAAAGARALGAYRHDMPGVYRAVVRVPDSLFLPPLPMRDDEERTYYPIGEVYGWWTAPELKAAERRGAELVTMHEALCWPDEGRRASLLYAGVVRRWYELREAAGEGSPWFDLYADIARALTGKLAQAPDARTVQINPDQGAIAYCAPNVRRSILRGCTRERCSGNCGAWRQLDRDGRIWSIPQWSPGESSHVQHAAYLTAATRINLQDAADTIGTRLVYANTDSLWIDTVEEEAIPFPVGGRELGGWERKHGFSAWRCIAPNVYRTINADTGEAICRAGGLPTMTDKQWAKMARHDVRTVERGVLTLAEAAPGSHDGLFRARRWKVGVRRGEGWYGDRLLDAAAGRTYPRPYDEARQARQAQGRGARSG